MDGNALKGVAGLAIAGLFAIPLAVWKLIDIVVWVSRHLHWN
jgi:hypothetical protein